MANFGIIYDIVLVVLFLSFHIDAFVEEIEDISCTRIQHKPERKKTTWFSFAPDYNLVNITLDVEKSSRQCTEKANYEINESGSGSGKVFKACRGVFNVCSKQRYNVTNIECEDTTGTGGICIVCRSEYSITRLELLESINGSCDNSAYYGHLDTKIWVNHGCKGVFRVYTIPVCSRLNCSSHNNDLAVCYPGFSVHRRIIRNVTMLTRYSTNLCGQAITTDKFETAFRVKHECRGKFEVCSTSENTICRAEKCEGTDGILSTCAIREGSYEVVITSIAYTNSENPNEDADEFVDFGFAGDIIWTKKRLSGIFTVCYRKGHDFPEILTKESPFIIY